MVAFFAVSLRVSIPSERLSGNWYAHSFKWLRSEARSKDELKDAMIKDARVGPESCRLQFSDRVFLPTYDGDVLVLGLA